jgi:pimeloyl-ACP methyl ester carboxylesterase
LLVIENQSRWTDVEGGRVHFLIEGGVQGRPVVLLHGARFSASTWWQIGTLRALADAGYLAYAIDIPGFGESAPLRGSPLTWLRSLLETLNLTAPVVVSPSMSGKFAWPLLTDLPERLSGFVAVAPVGIPRYLDQLQRITIPLLAIWGERDRIIPISQADLLVQRVRGAQKVIIPGGDHAPYMSDSHAFHAALFEFLSELCPASYV